MMEVDVLMARMGARATSQDARLFLEHPETEEVDVIGVLRNRTLPVEIIEAIARHERWKGRHAVRAAIVNHPKAPRTLALRLLSLLFWKELLRVSNNYRVAMPVRIAAEARLRERWPELEPGERITLARLAPLGLIPVLAEEGDARVISALLGNPRLREIVVVALAQKSDIASDVLRVIADHGRWSCRWSVKEGLLKNPRTPVHSALRLLGTLPGVKLKALVEEGHLPPVVHRAAERILADRVDTHRRL